MQFIKIVHLIFLLVLILANSSSPQSISSEIKDLSRKADIIVTGKVLDQKSDWNKDKSRISTRVIISVDEYLKGGDNQKTISVVHPGGEVDGVGELYTHIPRFEKEEEVLLFLERNNAQKENRVVAGETGKVNIYEKNPGGEKMTALNKNLTSLKREIRESLR